MDQHKHLLFRFIAIFVFPEQIHTDVLLNDTAYGNSGEVS